MPSFFLARPEMADHPPDGIKADAYAGQWSDDFGEEFEYPEDNKSADNPGYCSFHEPTQSSPGATNNFVNHGAESTLCPYAKRAEPAENHRKERMHFFSPRELCPLYLGRIRFG